ncbi:electron transfer flavoprotein subunit alpha/FixB family protein [Catenulispora sp. NL8]|uniref:Electron transfer flavoprotein subunit alpha/FixB family protein n=1 Tax=Catenulispora pinistramenti TaxID=2705254 RepID=A0ABS5L8A1_9ACTN|nr:electron transfer flavoprotein subunit alpha/FixB family protein [Catenulispora pinistramenti]MBS2554571.1 electron transfer flavoprotein subunit alpha/FixB family protein [Catenulispora pinistramenti]
MAEILVLVDHADGAVKKVTLELLTKARALGTPSAVFIGAGYDKAAEKLAEYGAAKAYVAEDAELDGYVTAPKAELLAKLVAEHAPAAVLVPATAEGKEVAARLAIKTGSGVLTDAVDVSADLVAEQSIFGGSTVAHSKVAKGTPIIAMRPNATAPEAAPATAERVDVSVELTDAAKLAKVVEKVVLPKGDRPELTEASIVVSGGRGVGSGENFAVIEKLADALGAAVGASRAAVDAGWYPHQAQVGQTGKTVSPQLYIAAGISGAIQHRAGMQTSKTIVAINKDEEAPIFELADYGVIGDLFKVVPQVTDEILKRK